MYVWMCRRVVRALLLYRARLIHEALLTLRQYCLAAVPLLSANPHLSLILVWRDRLITNHVYLYVVTDVYVPYRARLIHEPKGRSGYIALLLYCS